MVQWLRLNAFTTGGAGSIPDQGTKIPHAAQCGQKILQSSFQGLRMRNVTNRAAWSYIHYFLEWSCSKTVVISKNCSQLG